MDIKIFKDKTSLAGAAAAQAATSIRKAIFDQGEARIIAATGASQVEFLDALTAIPDVDWKRVEMFHLDEYIGLPLSHPASFRSYLLKRLINKVGITRYHLLDGELDPAAVARAVAACFEGKISPDAPASILRTHPKCTVYLDHDSAALLTSARPVH